MATSTALVPLGDRDYLMKIIDRNASDKTDVLNAMTAREAQALSDVAIVVKSESIGEAWQGGRNYLCQWLVSHFPIFDELAIRIHDRKRKGLSPLIIKGKPCSEFKEAIRLLLDADPSYYYKLCKKHLGGGWRKALPAEATAPDKAEVAETSVTDIKVGEPDAKDAEVCDPDPVPMPSDETVDKVHSAANEPESPIVQKEANDWLRTDLRSHLLASFPDLNDANVRHDDERIQPLQAFLHGLPEAFFKSLYWAVIKVDDEKCKAEDRKMEEERDSRRKEAIAKVLAANPEGLRAKKVVNEVGKDCLAYRMGDRQNFFKTLRGGAEAGVFTKRGDRYYVGVPAEEKPKATKRSEAARKAADILQESEPEVAASIRNAIAPFMEKANPADGEATAASPAVQSVEYRRERVSEILEALREAKDAQKAEPDEAKRHAIRDAAEDKAYVATKELILASTRGKVQAALTKALPREERWTLLDSPISHALSDSRAEFKYQELPSEQYKRLAREDAERAHLWKAGEEMPESVGATTGAGMA